MKMFRYLPLCLAVSAACMAPAQAQSLVELYESARASDSTYQSAKAQYDANLAKADQGRAQLLPTANLTAGANRNFYDQTVPRIDRDFTGLSTSLGASQPLYRPANLATYQQAMRSVEIARAQLLQAEQDLVIRVSQSYFDVLGAQDTLEFVRAQKLAVAEQLASAKRNFEVGTATITDTREAQARYDLVIAQEIAADNDLKVKKLALDILVSKTNAQPAPLALPVVLPPVMPADIDVWTQQAEADHPGVQVARVNLDIARLETEKAKAGHKPTLDLTASYGVNRYPSGSTTSAVAYRSNVATVGLSLNVPLFAGFSVQNRIRETLSLEDKAAADLEAARRLVVQGTRANFFGVTSFQGQVKAYEAAESSSQLALDANKLGYQVGVRINIDVLNSQSQLFQTKRDLASARYNVLVGGLKLKQANGTLRPEDLQAVNALLAQR